jgi:hypothetical protein
VREKPSPPDIPSVPGGGGDVLDEAKKKGKEARERGRKEHGRGQKHASDRV